MILQKKCMFFSIALSLFLLGITTQSQTATVWKKRIAIEFENMTQISSDAENNEHCSTHTPDGQMFYSINGHKIWWNKNADPEKKEPTALISFSAGAVQKCDVSYTALSLLPNVFLEGTVWGILAPDHVKKPKEKYLYTFVQGDSGYYWQKDDTMPHSAEYVSAANDGTVLVLTSDGPYLKIDNNPWKKLACSTKLTFVAVANKDTFYALTDKHTALVWKNNTWELLENNKQKDDIRHIAAKNDGTLYCTDKHGKAFYYTEKKGWIALPDIKNAQRIAVSPKKVFCWTSQPYGNAVLKNHVTFVGKAASIITGGGLAILGTGAIAAGAVGIGAAITSAKIAAPLVKAPTELSKTKKVLEEAENAFALVKKYATFESQETYAKYLMAKQNLAASRDAKRAAENIYAKATRIEGPLLVLAPIAVGVGAVMTVPVIIVEGAIVATLLGAGAAIVLMIVSRPHNNEVYELAQEATPFAEQLQPKPVKSIQQEEKQSKKQGVVDPAETKKTDTGIVNVRPSATWTPEEILVPNVQE